MRDVKYFDPIFDDLFDDEEDSLDDIIFRKPLTPVNSQYKRAK